MVAPSALQVIQGQRIFTLCSWLTGFVACVTSQWNVPTSLGTYSHAQNNSNPVPNLSTFRRINH